MIDHLNHADLLSAQAFFAESLQIKEEIATLLLTQNTNPDLDTHANQTLL